MRIYYCMLDLSNVYIAEKLRKFASAEHEMKVGNTSLHKKMRIRKATDRY